MGPGAVANPAASLSTVTLGFAKAASRSKGFSIGFSTGSTAMCGAAIWGISTPAALAAIASGIALV